MNKPCQYAILLIALLLASCDKYRTEPIPQEDKPVKFMVLTDIHYMHPDILRQEGKAWSEYNWEECKLLKESQDIFNAVIDSARAVGPDFILVCGDMTKDGEVVCHQYVADAFRRLEKEIGTNVLIVPGNHDMNNPHSLYYDGDTTSPAETADETKFEQIYSDLGYSDAVARREGSLDYMAYPADGIAVICVDSNEKNTPEKVLVQGGLNEVQVAWISEMAMMARTDGRKVLMMMHHNLVDFYDNAQLIRGANIANARYDYNNRMLIDDLCAAGVDVVFSGHSHMHSITSATSDGHTIYSVVTSSLVNLPLAFRIGTISRCGTMKLWTSDVKDCKPSDGVDLREEGARYWLDLSDYYMSVAADKVWEYGALLMPALGIYSRDDLKAFLDENFKNVFFTFTLRTSDGNEHLVSPKQDYDQAMAAIDGFLNYLDKRHCKNIVDVLVNLILGFGIDDVRGTMSDFFSSAYFNYLGDGPVMPDDCITIQWSSHCAAGL